MEKRMLSKGLVRAEGTIEVYCPPEMGISVSDAQFSETLIAQAKTNGLPVETQVQHIEWEGTGGAFPHVSMRHTDPAWRMVQVVVGLRRVGAFHYVEHFLCWVPPELPPEPKKRVPDIGSTKSLNTQFRALVLAELAGAVGAVLRIYYYVNRSRLRGDSSLTFSGDESIYVGLLSVGLFLALWLLVVTVRGWRRERANYPENQRLHQATLAFDQAVNEWTASIRDTDLRSRTDNEFRRFHAAVSGTIQQAVQKLYLDQNAELRDRKEKEMSRQELEAELERRKQEGFR